MIPVFATLARLLATEPAVALVTVAGVRGSAPREAGARMIVTAGGDIAGTIGGGRLELEAIAAARAMIAAGTESFAVRRFALGPALGQCCGGHVTLGIETIAVSRLGEVASLARAEAAGPFETEAEVAEGAPVHRRLVGPTAADPGADLDDGVLREVFGAAGRPVWLFGAGHVGRALVLALAGLPFRVTWVDERAEMFPGAVPGNVRLVVAERPEELMPSAPEGAMVLVMTHDHAVDLAIVHAALARPGIGYVGVIGSATKRTRFERRLEELGHAPERARAFRCPIGVPGIRSKEPAVIAAAVAAELLIEDEAARAAGRRRPPPLVAAVGRRRRG